MPHNKTYLMNGTPFITSVLSDTNFRRDGFLQGTDGALFYTVMNPKRHVVSMWKKQGGPGDYEATAKSLGATAYTNGPQMDNPSIGKHTPHKIAGGGAVLGVGAAVAAKALGATLLAATGVGVVVLFVVAIGGLAYLNYQAAQFAPFSTVNGDAFSKDDGRGYDNWASFGRRSGTSLADYEMKMTGLPSDLPEVCGGMSPLVDNWQAFSSQPNTPGYNSGYAGAVGAAEMAAWALVPIPLPGTPLTERGLQWPMFPVNILMQEDQSFIEGLIVAVGTETESQRVAPCLASIGARSAVATDGSGSVMYGSGTVSNVPGKWSLVWKGRQELQTYGIAAATYP